MNDMINSKQTLSDNLKSLQQEVIWNRHKLIAIIIMRSIPEDIMRIVNNMPAIVAAELMDATVIVVVVVVVAIKHNITGSIADTATAIAIADCISKNT